MGVSLKNFVAESYHAVNHEIARATYHPDDGEKRVQDYALDGFVYGFAGGTLGSVIGAPFVVNACKTKNSPPPETDEEYDAVTRKVYFSAVVGTPGIILGMIAGCVGAGIGACVGAVAKGVKAVKKHHH